MFTDIYFIAVLTFVFITFALLISLFGYFNLIVYATEEYHETVSISYTPSYSTQYVISVPTGLALNVDGIETSLAINASSWSDFLTDKKLYCELSGSNTLLLTNSSNSIGMTVKNIREGVEYLQYRSIPFQVLR